MPYSFQERLARVGTRMAETAGETVTYRRGNAAVSITAVPIKRLAAELIPGVAVTQVQYQDFVIQASALILDRVTVLPKAGDEILWGSETYRLVSEDSNSPPYHPVTSSQGRLRLHTLRITNG